MLNIEITIRLFSLGLLFRYLLEKIHNIVLLVFSFLLRKIHHSSVPVCIMFVVLYCIMHIVSLLINLERTSFS